MNVSVGKILHKLGNLRIKMWGDGRSLGVNERDLRGFHQGRFGIIFGGTVQDGPLVTLSVRNCPSSGLIKGIWMMLRVAPFWGKR